MDMPTPSPPAGRLALAMKGGMDDAVAALEVADPARAVHDLRKALKQMRALLRLVRGSGRAQAKALRRELAEAARGLSEARDVAARRESLGKLESKGLLDSSMRVQAEAVLAAQETESGDAFAVAERARLRVLFSRAAPLAMELAAPVGNRRLIAAIAEDYRRARRTGRRVDICDDEDLHELRKTVIATRYQMALVREDWPDLVEFWEVELQRLREKLGQHHDLAVLLAEVPAGETAAWQQPLRVAAAARRDRLVEGAVKLQARLFAEKPKAFARRLRSYMRSARQVRDVLAEAGAPEAA